MKRPTRKDLPEIARRLDAFPNVLLAAVMLERATQDKQWGGAEHDNVHSFHDWAEYIEHQLVKGREEAGTEGAQESFYDRMVKVAALALAALEANERAFPPAPCECPSCQLRRALEGVGQATGYRVISLDDMAGAEDLLSELFGRPRKH